MKKVFQKIGLYPFLVPIFFVLHGYVENFGLVGLKDCISLLATYIVTAGIIFLIFLFFFKTQIKAALVSAYILFFYLFFGAIHDFFRSFNFPLYKYKVIIPVFFAFLLFAIIYLKKTKKTFLQSVLFLNLLFSTFILADGFVAMWKLLHADQNKIFVLQSATNSYKSCENCRKPDIYLLLFDEYASSSSLKQRFNYDNSQFDYFLTSHGFHILRHSHSNYDITPFSMASILNMNYLRGIRNSSALTIEDYANSTSLIQNNQVIKYLSSMGYEIVNYSIFELGDNSSKVEQTFLPLKTKSITDRTLWGCLQKERGWFVYGLKFKMKILIEKILFKDLYTNETFIDLAKKESQLYTGKPKFVYVHLLIPHSPYYYDKYNHKKNVKDLNQSNPKEPYREYLDYLPYTNEKAKELINTIQNNTNDSAVIIFLSDHGFRYTTDPKDHSNFFENQNAIYFPGRDYSTWSDSIVTVNEFRLLFNNLFKTEFPLLKDSTFLLANKSGK